jgi:hypothetical protein
MSPPHETDLARFRVALYATGLGRRKDSLFETVDAVLTATGPETLARLCLAPGFRRRWASVPDALADGQVRCDAVRALVVRSLPARPSPELVRPLWVGDASTWPRPAARTSPERTYCHRVTAGVPQSGIVAGWEYHWLVAVPEAQGSWILPLDIARRAPPPRLQDRGAPKDPKDTPTALVVRQLRAALADSPADAPRPVVALDSNYDPVAVARAQREPTGLAVDAVVRLASHRVFYRAPGPYAGTGRPRVHGPVFRCKDPTTHGVPDRQATLEDPDYGTVTVGAWTSLHVRQAPDAAFTVVRVQVARLPRRERPPAPLWLAWLGGPLPDDLPLVWRWYLRRFTVEHGLRFAKQTLGWTTVRPRHPAAADRWTWLIALALWQLWLARGLLADARLPWEAPQSPERLSPGRVRRAFAGLFVQIGTPAKPAKPRGKSPGRRAGQAPGPAPRCAVVRRSPKRPRRPKKRPAAAA